MSGLIVVVVRRIIVRLIRVEWTMMVLMRKRWVLMHALVIVHEWRSDRIVLELRFRIWEASSDLS